MLVYQVDGDCHMQACLQSLLLTPTALPGAVTAGTTIFLLAGPVTAKRSAGSQDSLLGFVLMGGYLTCDGFTSTFQVAA